LGGIKKGLQTYRSVCLHVSRGSDRADKQGGVVSGKSFREEGEIQMTKTKKKLGLYLGKNLALASGFGSRDLVIE